MNQELFLRSLPVLKHWAVVFAIALAMCMTFGCGAPAKQQLDGVGIIPVANPVGRPPAVIVSVTDLRQFTDDVSAAGVPSMDRREELSDRAIRVRTIGRFMTSWTMGAPASDVILPPEQSVETLVLSAVQDALRAKGYTVVEKGSAGSPVTVEITKFWLWPVSPAFGPTDFRTEVKITLKGPITLSGNTETVAGIGSIHPAFVLAMGRASIDYGLEDLSKNIQARIKSP